MFTVEDRAAFFGIEFSAIRETKKPLHPVLSTADVLRDREQIGAMFRNGPYANWDGDEQLRAYTGVADDLGSPYPLEARLEVVLRILEREEGAS